MEDQTADYKIESLESKAREIQDAGSMSEVRDEVEDIESTLAQLPTRLQEARTRGYVFKSYLEEQIASLQKQWEAVRGDINREIDRRSRSLSPDLDRAERAVRRLYTYKGRPLSTAQVVLNQVEGELESVERRVEAAVKAIRGMYDSLQSEVRRVRSQVSEALELLDLMDQASFGFRVGEAGVAAVKAKWLKDGRKEGPKGILFLTDQRLIFEQREKKATKKFLFITTASEEVKELQWEAPIGAVVEAKASEKRRALILKKEQLELHFKPPATVREVLLELEEDSETWRALINRVLTGEIDKERVKGQGAEPEAKIEVPTHCPSCGARLDVTVTRGMTAIKCAYCGTNIPLTSSAS